jgi:hypothetical protein
MGEMRNIIQYFGRKSEGRRPGGRIILEWILVKFGRKVWTGCIWLRIGTSGGLL